MNTQSPAAMIRPTCITFSEMYAGALIQHIRNHIDHMHVRFFTPWSTLAAHIGPDEDGKQSVIEMAQQSYLPKKVNYYVSGSEKGLDELAKSFGVTTGDLCRWNHISPPACSFPAVASFSTREVLKASRSCWRVHCSPASLLRPLPSGWLPSARTSAIEQHIGFNSFGRGGCRAGCQGAADRSARRSCFHIPDL